MTHAAKIIYLFLSSTTKINRETKQSLLKTEATETSATVHLTSNSHFVKSAFI